MLVIYTYGNIQSIKQTSLNIQAAAELPMTIIFVVLGRDYLAKMDYFQKSSCAEVASDMDNLLSRPVSLESNTHIVQYEDFKADKHLLQRKLLAKLADQVPAYFKAQEIDPGVFDRRQRQHVEARIMNGDASSSRPDSHFFTMRQRFIDAIRDANQHLTVLEIENYL